MTTSTNATDEYNGMKTIEGARCLVEPWSYHHNSVLLPAPPNPINTLRGAFQKKTGYLVKSCKKVGGGLVQIIIFNVREKVTNYQEGGASGLLSLFNFIVKSQLLKLFYLN